MGRQTNISLTDLAYVAGFLDGDGSVMIQVKNRRHTPKGWRLMFTICFYQKTTHEKHLFWIQRKLGIGYISRRTDGMTELRINGYERVREILVKLSPYIKFKKEQIKILLCILRLICGKKFDKLSRKIRLRIADLICESRKFTYQSGWKKLSKPRNELRKMLGF